MFVENAARDFMQYIILKIVDKIVYITHSAKCQDPFIFDEKLSLNESGADGKASSQEVGGKREHCLCEIKQICYAY